MNRTRNRPRRVLGIPINGQLLLLFLSVLLLAVLVSVALVEWLARA